MTLTGATVSLVPLRLAHVADFLKYSKEPSLWIWWLRRPPNDEATMVQEVELALSQLANGLRVPFSIFHRSRGEYIGSTSLWNIDRVNRTLEIGSTWLALPFQGTGINHECKSLLLWYAFVELGMNRVVFQTDELNVRSRKAIEGLGAILDGILRQDKVTWNGRVRSSAIYSLMRSEWYPKNKM
jgi:RimJ/RimL family protein N-acetyltransferase